MRVLGIDPGTGILGFGVVENGRQQIMVDAGVVRTKVHQPEPERLEIIFDSLNEIIKAAKPVAGYAEPFAADLTLGQPSH